MKFSYNIKRKIHLRRVKFSYKFNYTRKDLYIAEFGKELVEFYYKYIYKEKGIFFLKVGNDNKTNTAVFKHLQNSKIISFSFITLLFCFIFSINTIPQSKKTNKDAIKTITGYIVDENNNPWNNQLASIMLGDSTVATDTIRNGQFTIDNLVSVKDKPALKPEQFKLEQNYPNPFNPTTTIQYTLTNTSNVLLEVYDILGRKVKTLLNSTQNAGTHSVVWDGTRDDGGKVASGIYIYREIVQNQVTGEKNSQAKKAVYEKHNANNDVWGRTGNTANNTGNTANNTGNTANNTGNTSNNTGNTANNTARTANNSINKTNIQGADYKLKISGEDVLTTIEDIDLSGTSPIDLGTTTAPNKPVLKSTANGVYDIDTKYDENNNRITPIGIDSMKVFLGSNPEVFTYTNANGQFTLKVDKLGIDSIFITGKTAVDTTYYNWHLPSINITQGENNITAFNDTTGIPMISRMWDTGLTAPQTGETNVSVDFLDYLCHVTRIINKFPTTPEWRQAMPRVRDEDLPIKVYMNRAIDPTNGWYADSSWVGLKASEAGRFRFVEVADSSEALMIIRYDNDMVGQGTNVGIDFDVSGPYISHWDIRIRGPLNGSVLQPKDAVAVMAHEPLHLAFCFGEHSLYMQDMFYGDPWSRMNRGYPLKLSEREEKAITTIFNLERNIKLLDYTR